MPEPQQDESQDDFISRCIPVVLKDGAAKDNKQAAAVCHSMWSEAKQEANLKLFSEAKIQKTGREWEVTIIGAQTPKDVITIDGDRFIQSDNGRLYSVEALANSVSQWDGVKVFDNHLTQEEFEKKQGMRSPATEWLGTIVKPRWDAARAQLRGVFKVVDNKLAEKLKNAFDQGVLSTIGLSIDTIPIMGREIFHEGQRLPVIAGISQIQSVDVVMEPAAGGRFERLIAAKTHKEFNDMSEETTQGSLFADSVSEETVQGWISDGIAAALAAREAESQEEELEAMDDEEILAAKDEQDLTEAQKELLLAKKEATRQKREAAIAKTDLLLERKIDRAKMPDKFADILRQQYTGRVAEADELDAAIKAVREAYVSTDITGRVKAGSDFDLHVGMDENDKFGMAFMRIMTGESELRELESNEDETVQERLTETPYYNAWLKAGKPTVVRYPKMSSLLYDYFGGDPLLDQRVAEAATTATLTTVVKNTVNIMAANAYSQREMWWEPIVTTHEVDTIDDATLARVYGTDVLPTVAEGAAYTELPLEDEEETASFVKRGGYIGITIEVLMRDKISFVRRIPQGLADAWYNTQSDLVSNVFTVNTATGPVLGTTGALFNATALTSAGGHANLLTTGLSHSEFGVVRTAMQKQTDQTLGTGRRLAGSNVPRYVLVPVDLEQTALEILNSELEPGADFDAAGGGAQTVNLWRGSFQVIVVPPWTDTNNWAAASALPAIHLIYPRGQRAPQIFSADSETSGAMFTNDELRFKARLMTYRFSGTYDCAPVSDFRPLHKSNV
jgi:hypothetical protein